MRRRLAVPERVIECKVDGDDDDDDDALSNTVLPCPTHIFFSQ